MTITPISFSGPSLIIDVPKIRKSPEVLAREDAINKLKAREEDFKEREESFRRILPFWLEKNVNFLA